MHIGFILFSLSLLFSLHIPACCAVRDTISAGEALVVGDKLVSPNGRFALGFFQPSGKSSRHHTPKHWYLGVWFDKISKITPIWIANRENPIVGHHRITKLTISGDGNLVIVNRATESMVWSTVNVTAENTTAVLLDSGNLVLRGASNILWQSFDYPTDVILNGAKIGLNKVTHLNSRIVSKKNLIDPAPGLYCLELDPTGAGQFVLKLCNSSIVYWSTGEWNGQYFNSMPEMSGRVFYDFNFTNNDQEEYFEYNLQNETLVTVTLLHSSGQIKSLFCLEETQDWMTVYTIPKDQCDVYATCGSFTICNNNAGPVCDCMKGFTVRSYKDWELQDQTGGCIRNTPLDCSTRNQSKTTTTDKFYPLPSVGLLAKGHIVGSAGSADQCALACLSNCSCTAYSYANRCSIWYDDLLNVRRYNNGTTSDGAILYLRIAAKDAESSRNSNGGKGKIILAVIAPSVVALSLLSAFLMWFLLISLPNAEFGLR